jgi:hypothetical protein
MTFSKKDLERLQAEGKIRGFVENTKAPENYSQKSGKNIPGQSKYGSRKTELDGIVFDSAKEAKRYLELRYLLNGGEITDLKLQVEFELNEGGTHSLKYIADFVYDRKGVIVVEDAKGFRTREYKKKRRLMREVHGIEIIEV